MRILEREVVYYVDSNSTRSIVCVLQTTAYIMIIDTSYMR